MLPVCAVVTPEGHDVQAAIPDDGAYEPTAQRAHVAAPAVTALLPMLQGAQLAAEAPKKPGAQTEQALALVLPKAEPAGVVPEGHALQPDARDEPLLATTPKKPGAHDVHARSQAPAA